MTLQDGVVGRIYNMFLKLNAYDLLEAAIETNDAHQISSVIVCCI